MTDSTLDPPPSYSSLSPPIQPTPPAPSTLPERTGTHEYHLQHLETHHSASLQIVHSSHVLYYIRPFQSQNKPDLILYAGYDSNGPQLALAQFQNFTKDFKIYIGGQKSPTGHDWDVVRCYESGFLKDPKFRFEAQSQQKMYWTKTSDKKLGASRFSPRDHKLVDVSDERVLAVYVEFKLGEGRQKGVIRFKEKLSEVAEMQALMVLLSLLEKSRRYMRAVNRAFPNTNGW